MRARRRKTLTSNPAPARAGAGLRQAVALFDAVAFGFLIILGPWLLLIILEHWTLAQLARFAP